MEKHLNASSSLFILFRNGNPLLHSTSPKDSSGIFFLTRDQAGPFLQSTSFAPVPAEIDEGDKEKVKHYQSARLPLTLPGLVFLGVDDRKHPTPNVSGNPTGGNRGGGEGGVIGECGHVEPPNLKHPDGVSYFAIDVDAQVYGETIDSLDEGKNRFVESRLAGNVLDGWQANLFAQARALIGESGTLYFWSFSSQRISVTQYDVIAAQTGTRGTSTALAVVPRRIRSGVDGNEGVDHLWVREGTGTVNRVASRVLLRECTLS